ncbi:MAG: hypothetical protein KBH51_01220 [Synergistales bacterium]|nr:hypothetical protein [Synergistales bacterium]
MKRAVAIVATIAVLALAGSALAYAGPGWGGYGCGGLGAGYGYRMPFGYGGGFGYMPRWMGRGDGPYGRGFDKISPEFRSQMNELYRARLELQLALTEENVDTSKVKQLHEKVLSLHDELARKQLERFLEWRSSQLEEQKGQQ